MKKIFCIFMSFVIFSVTIKTAYAQVPLLATNSEFASQFSSKITIHKDTSIRVQEIVSYSTTYEKHGIYRTIPYRYVENGLQFTARVHDIDVHLQDGSAHPFTVSKSNGNVVIKIGDKDKTFIGSRTYVLSYSVDHAVLPFEESARLYWDITGDGWTFPIYKTTVTVETDAGDILRSDCFTGVYGNSQNHCTDKNIEKNSFHFEYDLPASERVYIADNRPAYSSNNVTIDLRLQPISAFSFPTPTQKLIQQIGDNVLLFILPLPLIFLFWIWYRYGRDYMYIRYDVFDQSEREKVLRPLLTRFPPPMVYEPLDITPGQAGAMLDERYDIQDLVSDILDLVRIKYIRIEQIQEKTWLKSADYLFTKLKDTGDKLPMHQKTILETLFGSKQSVKLSELKGTFYVEIPKIQNQVFDSLFADTMFTRNPRDFQKKIGVFFTICFIFIFIGIQFSSVLAPLFFDIDSEQVFIIIAILIPEIIIGIFLVSNLTQKTAKGFNYMQQARGLKQTIAWGKWREEIKEKHLFIEEILPFAVALGVVSKLTRDMKELNITPPSYFHGSSLNAFTTASFVSSFTSDVGSSISYSPKSSSFSSGGGGFSGGGGGGGGGGSW